ncbi:glycerophosphodiester phosphodiesterase 1 [Aedes albopictus]|uniref:GP-PDE domain-containing protein n=1 Tax=Aedes albopictus TaxID=7160 RepID=A0ABM1YGK8_AEDAL|nr:glycerophosphodiester phosphodiesterase 1-like [Aedes albopictus]XP_029718426.1 glycerophosphodiester phosphodiesterase 1-like [Aedes albopictus]
MYFSTILKALKMIYQLFWFLTTCLTFLFNALWLCCNFASVGIPWLMLLFFLVCIASKFVKLRCPASDIVQSMLHRSEKGVGSEVLYWPIVSRGGAFDAPENSLAAINHCLSQKCYNILLDLNITSDGHLVVLNRTTLEKANINEPIHKLKLSALENFNISEHHPLGQHFQSEKIITFEKLLKLLETNELTVFLLATHTSTKLIELVREAIGNNSFFTKRIVFCCSSPISIYQLRQHCPDLICGLWMEKSSLSRTQQYLNASTILMSVYGAIFRNIVSPVIGISLVFIHKDEFNAQISTLWHNVGVRPIVYTINSPNEKRYFQQVTKTQYLTDSLRSEPQVIFRGKRK